MYTFSVNKDGSVTLWYPDGDEFGVLKDNLGLDLYAKDFAQDIMDILNATT